MADRPDIADRLCGDFYDIRLKAFATAAATRDWSKSEEVTIEYIYACMKRMTALSDDDADYLMALELSTEYENVVGIESNINILIDRINSGDRVVLISDMYIHTEDIRRMLVKCNQVFESIPIYVSCDCKALKETGNLYRYVRRDNLVRYSEWIHTGDDTVADISIPKSLGIQTVEYSDCRLLGCEQDILKDREYQPNLQMFTGCSKLTRVRMGNNTAVNLGSSYGAAILFQYSVWSLELCKHRGIKDVYCVARDGAIIYEIMRCLSEHLGYDMNVRYIYGSRRSWRPVVLGDEDTYDIRRYIEAAVNGGGYSIDDIANCLNLSADVVAGCLGLEDTDVTERLRWDGSIDGASYEAINNSKMLKSILIRDNSAECKLVEAYLKQELCISGKKAAFVEAFGTGRTQDMITNYIRQKLGIDMISLFYSRLCDIDTDNEFYDCIAIDSQKATVIETLTRALEGRTVGYEDIDGIITPVLDDDDVDVMTAYGYGDYVDAVIATVRGYMELAGAEGADKIGRLYFNYLTDEEDGEMLDYIAKMPISNTFFGDDSINEFAPDITQEMIEENAKKGFISINSSCFYFSYKRASEETKRQLGESYGKYLADNNKKLEEYWRDRIAGPHTYRISTDKLKSRIAIYGAGDVGGCLYRDLSASKDVDIVAWLDRKFTTRDGICDNPVNVADYDFEQIIIALVNEDVAMDIACDLVEWGVPEDKIYYERYEFVELA